MLERENTIAYVGVAFFCKECIQGQSIKHPHTIVLRCHVDKQNLCLMFNLFAPQTTENIHGTY